MGSLGKPAQAGARIPSQPPAGAGPRLCSALPRHRGSNLRVSWSRYSGSGGQSSPRASLASEPRCWGSLAGLYVSRSMRACSVPMVRRAGSNVRASWSRDLMSASGRCHCDRATGCRRQPARAGARNSSMPSAGEGPCLPVTILWRLGSNLRAAWSRYGVAMLGHRGRRVVPMGVAGSRPTQVRGFHSCRPHAGVLV